MKTLGHLLLALLTLMALTAPAMATCRWVEPPRSYSDSERWRCAAVRWADGDTFTAHCASMPELIRVRVRGLDTVERGDPRWRASRDELRRQTESLPLIVIPHHNSRGRVVADVLADNRNVGAAMDRAGWSKTECPRR